MKKSSRPRFLCVLIYQLPNGYVCEEPYVYTASHPEIAYQLAFQQGEKLLEYGREFIGLSKLEELTEDVQLIPNYYEGIANEMVIAKQNLAAFTSPNWRDKKFDTNELKKALTEPDFLMELDGVNDIPWNLLEHAYGTAEDIPGNLKQLVSSNAVHRDKAFGNLIVSITHQGNIYSAAVEAMPFILRILENRFLPDRGTIGGLLAAIAQGASLYRLAYWEKCLEEIETYDENIQRNVRSESAAAKGIHECLKSNLELIQKLASDPNPKLAYHAKEVIKYLTNPIAR